MSPFVRDARDPFVKQLALATLQFYSYVPSAPLVWGTEQPSIAAGLPHFSSGFMRNWGRDTFIALQGILLVTGRYEEAKREILGFARVCRHALIPNLLDSGNNPRYNARDATWFFLQGVQDYCRLAPEGNAFLQTKVDLKYGDQVPTAGPCAPSNGVQTVADLIFYILQNHAYGIEFREWNAGSKIDEHMTDTGFNVKIQFDPHLGIFMGGNTHNCGTWMDKMGSSAKAGNKGVPATPRDGAAVEIVGLLKSTLRWVTSLPPEIFPYTYVTKSDGTELLLGRWNTLLEARFEKLFWVPKQGEEGEYFVEGKWINKREIYKDTFRAGQAWCDYQLRPNLCIAMSVAPEMFSEAHARSALANVEQHLLGESGQLGPKTLDPSDMNFRPDYDNANDGEDKTVAHGFNYHQGPEWVWPLGFFLQSKLLFLSGSTGVTKTGNATQGGDAVSDSSSPINAPEETETWTYKANVDQSVRQACMKHLLNHRKHIVQDGWSSLPEITNRNGRFCPHGCPAQAWSIATPP
eukprot:GDKI01014079.1.p1 GENE.GDKI01014079.1~~GDKI01014079.1.p1  ORF type:complete len:520 (+),score=152.35 GDKI01014079.1:1-1560(+)